ncbi:MAG: Mov34/MPN/PAD-1 family protein [Blautia sp.]
MLVLKNDIRNKIYSCAKAEYPKECCGILLGRRLGKKKIAVRSVETRNMIDGRQSRTQFLINPLEIIKAELSAEKEELEIVGFYHSHPDQEAVVSEADLLHMIAGYSYLVISVNKDVCVRGNSFEKILHTDVDAKEEILVKER